MCSIITVIIIRCYCWLRNIWMQSHMFFNTIVRTHVKKPNELSFMKMCRAQLTCREHVQYCMKFFTFFITRMLVLRLAGCNEKQLLKHCSIYAQWVFIFRSTFYMPNLLITDHLNCIWFCCTLESYIAVKLKAYTFI